MDAAVPDATVRWKSTAGIARVALTMAVAFLGIAWFAARHGARRAPWVLLVSGVIWVRS